MHLALQTSEECHGKTGVCTYLGWQKWEGMQSQGGAQESGVVLRPDQLC